MKEKNLVPTSIQSTKVMVLLIVIFLTMLIGSKVCQAAFKPWIQSTFPAKEIPIPDFGTHAATHEPAEFDDPRIHKEVPQVLELEEGTVIGEYKSLDVIDETKGALAEAIGHGDDHIHEDAVGMAGTSVRVVATTYDKKTGKIFVSMQSDMTKCEHGWYAKTIQCLECVAEELGLKLMYLHGSYPAGYMYYGVGQYKRVQEIPCKPHKVKWTHYDHQVLKSIQFINSWMGHACNMKTCPVCKHRDVPQNLIEEQDCAEKGHWKVMVTGEFCRLTGEDAPSTGYDVEWALYINGSLSTDVIWTHEKR